MSKFLVNFCAECVSPEQIHTYYEGTLKALQIKKRIGRKCKYLSYSEREQAYDVAARELSIEAGFMLLSYVEALFRGDLVLRLENRKWKDPLSMFFRDNRSPDKKVFQYPMDTILKGWRKDSDSTKDMVDIACKLPQYFNYRHWVAHGRYWMPKEPDYVNRYRYKEIARIVDCVERAFESRLKRVPLTRINALYFK